jgi:hypothetical protein
MFVKTFVLLHLGFADVPGLWDNVWLDVEFFKREILGLLLLGFPGVSPSGAGCIKKWLKLTIASGNVIQ